MRSEGGIVPQEFTPESVGYEQTIIFGTDSVFERRRDDSLMLRATFFVARDSAVSPIPGDLLYLANIEGKPPGEPHPIAAIKFVGRDTLILCDLCVDCYSHWYQRLQPMNRG